MQTIDAIQPGARVRVHQRIRQADRWLTLAVEGEVVSLSRKPTGSWFAHGKNGRLWLDRLVLRKPDGAESELVIDEQSEIEILL
ncbi:MAG: hypothetical protein PHU85_13875 [Phycisphaerae bacterium]|nr:hypothetical protein [Phycisphaerae bacterium]